MDRISGLPEIILHDILARLPQKDAVTTSVLSKAWRETWSTFPVLFISDTQIVGKLSQLDEDLSDEEVSDEDLEKKREALERKRRDAEMKRKIFVDYMNKTLTRFYDRGLAIKELKFNVDCFNLIRYTSQDMDRWMKLVSESGVEVLELSLPIVDHHGNASSQDRCYTLQPGVLEAKTLNKVVLHGEIRVDQAFLNHSIKNFSLRVLSLDGVCLGDEEGAIEHLISHCPLMESITLQFCWVHKPISRLKSLVLHGLQKLNEVEVAGIAEVSIDAPNLEKLCYRMFLTPGKLNFVSCRNLRCLKLEFLGVIIADQWFLELFSKCPLLESLELSRCYVLERINISSAQLKVLEFYICNLKEVKIDAPNLLSCCIYFSYVADKPDISFLRSSSQLEVNVQIDTVHPGGLNVREFIESLKPQVVLASLTLFFNQRHLVDEQNLDVLLVSSPPPSIKHLKLFVYLLNKDLNLSLVNRLLASCCPETISFRFPSTPQFCVKQFIEIFYETLMGRKQGDCYCSSGDTKCWWHRLKDVKVTSLVNSDEIVDFRTMLDSLPTTVSNAEMEVEGICFRLEL